MNDGQDEETLAAAAASKKEGEATSITGASWATGIAEVALPESFKKRNMELTQQAAERQKQLDYLAAAQRKRERAQGGSGYYQRFQVSDRAAAANASALLGVDEDELDLKAFTARSAASADPASKPPRVQKSSDDLAMSRFKKQQGFRR